MSKRLSPAALQTLVEAKLVRSGASPANARPVAHSIVAAEADGMPSIGLGYLPTYCRHLTVGKVNGGAEPKVDFPRPGLVLVDAEHGFAHGAIEAGRPALVERAQSLGIAALAIRRSYSAGVLGHCIEPVARQGCIAIAFTNAPPSVAPWGGRKPLFGTNPLALACPRAQEEPLVVDMATSAVTKVALIARARRRERLPEGWALDADGRPTCDPEQGIKGSMAPFGGVKGAQISLMVELLAAGLTGANWSKDATFYANDEGGPPGVGQLIVAIASDAFDPTFLNRLEGLIAQMLAQDGVRLPGDRRLEARALAAREGIAVPPDALAFLGS